MHNLFSYHYVARHSRIFLKKFLLEEHNNLQVIKITTDKMKTGFFFQH